MWKTKKAAEENAGVLNQQRKNFKNPYIVFKDPGADAQLRFGICRTSERAAYAAIGAVFV